MSGSPESWTTSAPQRAKPHFARPTPRRRSSAPRSDATNSSTSSDQKGLSQMTTPVEREPPTRPAWAIGSYCELLKAKPTRTVRISVDAACDIYDEVKGFYDRSLYGADEETGGS